jgi:hypothetical protein
MSGHRGQVLPRPAKLFAAIPRGYASAFALLLAAAFFACPPPAQAAEKLSLPGARLEHAVLPPGGADLRRSVDLGGDAPSATYVTARTRGGAMMQRTRHGYWLPWSGREEDLADNGFAASGGALEFKVLKEALPETALPITVTLGYRTAVGVKFGMFEIRAP